MITNIYLLQVGDKFLLRFQDLHCPFTDAMELHQLKECTQCYNDCAYRTEAKQAIHYKGVSLIRATNHVAEVKQRIFSKYPFMQSPFSFKSREEREEVLSWLSQYHLYLEEEAFLTADREKVEEKRKETEAAQVKFQDKSPREQQKNWLKYLPKCFNYEFPDMLEYTKRTVLDVICPEHGFLYKKSIGALLDGKYNLCFECADTTDITPFLTKTGRIKANAPEGVKKIYYISKLPQGFDYEIYDDNITSKSKVFFKCKKHSTEGSCSLDKKAKIVCTECMKESEKEDTSSFNFFDKYVPLSPDAFINKKEFASIVEEEIFHETEKLFNEVLNDAENFAYTDGQEYNDGVNEEFMFNTCGRAIADTETLDKLLNPKELVTDEVLLACQRAVRGLTIELDEETDFFYGALYVEGTEMYVGTPTTDLCSDYFMVVGSNVTPRKGEVTATDAQNAVDFFNQLNVNNPDFITDVKRILKAPHTFIRDAKAALTKAKKTSPIDYTLPSHLGLNSDFK